MVAKRGGGNRDRWRGRREIEVERGIYSQIVGQVVLLQCVCLEAVRYRVKVVVPYPADEALGLNDKHNEYLMLLDNHTQDHPCHRVSLCLCALTSMSSFTCSC